MPRLKTVSRDDLTIIRRRRGKGFCYLETSGQAIADKAMLARFRHLGIPPAWREVRLAEDELAHIQCCGTDDAGRVQYIYHPEWECTRTRRKNARLTELTRVLPRIRRRVARDLSAEAGERDLALALAVALIDRTAMRVGRERYLKERGTRGAGTLYSQDVRVSGDEVFISFPAKSGKQAEYLIRDARIADAVTRIKTLPGRRLLTYRDAEGRVRPIKTQAINSYLRAIAGAEISGKDFRTLHASALAGEALAQLEPAGSEAGRKRQVATVTKEVAEFLRNTPMICRKSYIAPFLFVLFDKGKLREAWGAGGRRPRGRERVLGQLLEALA